MEVTNPSHFGTMVFDEEEATELLFPGDPRRKISVTRAQGQWRPPERLEEFLPDGLFVPIDCYTGPDGLRRLVPGCSFEELIDLGAVGGLAVMHGTGGFDPQVDHSYRAMYLIHQHVRGRAYRGTRGMKEHLTREFEYSRDLHVRRLGRLSDNERDVLPDDVGLTADGEGYRLSVTQLTELGRRAAQEAGYRNPTSSQAIAFGLFEAAKLNPLAVEAEQVPVLVQMALFDMDAEQNVPSEEFIHIVTERLLEAIQGHLDDSQAEFGRWFLGPKNSLVKQISQQKTKRGGRLRREEVRQALLHIGWKAYQYVGQCIHALMRTVKNSLPDPLNDDERQLFEHMYESQPYYGNLPLALLAERSHAIKLAVLAIWNEPDNRNHVRVLHRLLAGYAHMADERRKADRRSKQQDCPASSSKSPEQDPSGVLATTDSTDPNAEEPILDQGQPASSDGQSDPLESFDNSEQAHSDNLTAAAKADSKAEGPELNESQRPSGRGHAGPVEFNDNLHCPASSQEDPFAQIAEHIRGLRGIECEADCGCWEYRREGESETSVTIVMSCECGRVAQEIEMPIDEFTAHGEKVLRWKAQTDDSHPTDTREAGSES